MTEYYLKYGDDVDRRETFPDVKTARANAVRRIYSGYNVTAIVPVKSGRNITLITTRKPYNKFTIVAIHWNGNKRTWESHVLENNGSYGRAYP